MIILSVIFEKSPIYYNNKSNSLNSCAIYIGIWRCCMIKNLLKFNKLCMIINLYNPYDNKSFF